MNFYFYLDFEMNLYKQKKELHSWKQSTAALCYDVIDRKIIHLKGLKR